MATSETRIVVTGGGDASPEVLAALVVALTPTAAAPPSGPQAPPAWTRAALLESTGARPFTSASDLAGAAPGAP